MIKLLWIALVSTVFTGCVSTTQIVIKHHFPDEHINYEINQGWTREFQEKIMKLTYGSKINFGGEELTFTKIENTKSNGFVCFFSDKNGTIAILTQQEVELAVGL